jgi:hypothetical protein
MGKRTKHQVYEHAQLLLVAKSSLVDQDSQSDARALDQVILTKSHADHLASSAASDLESKEGIWEHSKFELGRRVVTESATGEEVSIRNVKLDDTDGGESENILLEEGVHFSHKKSSGEHGEGDEEDLSSTLLHPVDQSIILSLCLDVGNSNPAVCSLFLSVVSHSPSPSPSLSLSLAVGTVGWSDNGRDASLHPLNLEPIPQASEDHRRH